MSRGGRKDEKMRKLFLGGLHRDTTDEDIKSHFSKFGHVVDQVVIRKGNEGESKGFGFVTMSSVEETDLALTENVEGRQQLAGNSVEVKRAIPREDSMSSKAVKKMYIGNLPSQMSEQDLEDFFSQHGTVTSVKIPTSRETNERQKYAFVELEETDAVDKLVSQGDHTFMDFKFYVKKAMPQGERDRNRGGGGGRFGGGRYGGNEGYGGGGGGYRRGGGRGGYGGGGGRYGGSGYGGGSGGGYNSSSYDSYGSGGGGGSNYDSFGSNYGQSGSSFGPMKGGGKGSYGSSGGLGSSYGSGGGSSGGYSNGSSGYSNSGSSGYGGSSYGSGGGGYSSGGGSYGGSSGGGGYSRNNPY